MKTTSLVFATLIAFAACSKSGDKAKPADEPAGDDVATRPQTPAEKAPATTAGDGAATMDALLVEYEAVREKLAADTGAGVADHAKTIAATARALPARPELAELATAADKLAATDAGDLEALRLAFGEVSKPLVALAEADPELSKDLHTFECPMAKGYKRWIQPDAKLENPYMGQKMLACGSEIKN